MSLVSVDLPAQDQLVQVVIAQALEAHPSFQCNLQARSRIRPLRPQASNLDLLYRRC
jgi:hypothetical protein